MTDVNRPAVAALETIDLEALTALADLQTRRDRKYLVPPDLVGPLVAQLPAPPQVLTIDGRHAFRYESVYFDTPDFASYLGAARRRPRRFKVRTRSYLDSGVCLLEVKVRDGRGRTVKHRDPYDIERRLELTEGARRFVRMIDPAAGAVDELAHTLTSTYRRTTLVLADGQARVTLDADLTWQRPVGDPAGLDGCVLVETKTVGPPCDFDRALWRSGYRPITISKYATALAALTPALPANKWNRVLRRYFTTIAASGASGA